MKKRAIVSFANSNGNYMDLVKRQAVSMEGDNQAEYFQFINEDSVGAPSHQDNPYAFKLYCIDHVRSLGYEQILWIDSSLVRVNSTKPIWDVISKQGYFMNNSGWSVGRWCNEQGLAYFNLTRDAAMLIPMFHGGFFGLDFTNKKAIKYYDQIKQAMNDGIFKGSWDDHRHDMTCGGVIAYRNKMKLLRGDEWLSYAAEGAPPKDDTIIFHAV